MSVNPNLLITYSVARLDAESNRVASTSLGCIFLTRRLGDALTCGTIRLSCKRVDVNNIVCGRGVELDAPRAAATPKFQPRRLPPLRRRSVLSVPRLDLLRDSSIEAERLGDRYPARARLSADTADMVAAERRLTGRRYLGAGSRQDCRPQEDSPGPTGSVNRL